MGQSSNQASPTVHSGGSVLICERDCSATRSHCSGNDFGDSRMRLASFGSSGPVATPAVACGPWAASTSSHWGEAVSSSAVPAARSAGHAAAPKVAASVACSAEKASTKLDRMPDSASAW